MVNRTGSEGRTRVRAALGLTIALAAGLGAAGRAEAGPNLTFTLAPQSGEGRIGYAGGSSPLQGTGLQVASVKGLETGAHANGQLSVDSGGLSFSTGAFKGTSAGGAEWDFDKGGSIELNGGIAALGIPTGTKLLSGTFSNDSFVKQLGADDLKVNGGAFMNVVNPVLAAYFGLPTGSTVYVGGLATLFSAPTTAGGKFTSSSLTSGSVTTQPVTETVPEPGTLAVFSALAAGGALFARRRRVSA